MQDHASKKNNESTSHPGGPPPAVAGKNVLRLVFWESTVGCNLECVHCRRLEVSSELAKQDLTTEQSLDLVDQIRDVGQPILVLSGGEPLFRPDIFQIAKHARDRELPVALATNGTLVDDEMARRIVDAGIRRVSISLDGPDSAIHDEFRKLPGSFESAIAGLRRLRELGMSVQINSTIAKHNVDRVKEMYRLALDLGADAFHIFMLVPVGCGVEIAADQMLDPEKYEEVLNWFYDVTQEGKIQTKATCAPHYFRIARQRAKAEGKTLEKGPQSGMHQATRGCLAGQGVCFVSHQGDVFPCGYLPVTSGNILKTPLKEIWETSKVFKDLRNPDDLEGKCGLCEYRVVCEGCRARAYAETGNYMAEEPYCIYTPKKGLGAGGVRG